MGLIERTCRQCGKTKPIDRFRPYRCKGQTTGIRTMCRDCENAERRTERQQESAWRRPQNGRPRVPEAREWSLTKRCSHCGETKPWAMFSPARYWDDGSVRLVHARCKECQAKLRRGRHRKATSTDLVRIARWNKRKRRALKVERGQQAGRRLVVGPFRVWLAIMVREHGSILAVANLVGVDERTLRRTFDGTHTNVLERVADQCFTRTGYHLNDFYGDEAEAA